MRSVAEKRSFQLGEHVTVSVPDAVAEQVAAALDEAFGRRRNRSRARARATEERLSADRIVDVAIEQMRAHGYDAVTMRSIARALGTGPASLYAHVANRAELDQLVVGRVAGLLEVPDPDPEHWDDQLRQAMRDLLAIYRGHPGVARATLGMIPVEPGVLLLSERLLGLLRAGGIADQDAAWAVDVLSLLVASVAVEEDIWRQRGAEQGGAASEEATVAQVRAVFAKLPPEHFPLLTSMAGVLTAGGGDDRFEFAVTLLVEGLKAVSRRP